MDWHRRVNQTVKGHRVRLPGRTAVSAGENRQANQNVATATGRIPGAGETSNGETEF